MSKLSVVDRLRLVRYFTPEEAQKGCGGADACYSADAREVRFFRGAPYGGEPFTLAHERTHAHQHQMILDAGLGEPSDSNPTRRGLWVQTEEGKAFAAAVNAVLADNRANGTPLPWEGFGSNLTEDGANISATWYTDEQYIETQWPRWPAIRQFAETWLPK